MAMLCLVLLAPLAYPGSLQTHAGALNVYTLYAWESAGLPPVPSVASFSPNGSAGGDGPLALALAEGLRWLGMSSLVALAAVQALSLLLGGLGTWALARASAHHDGLVPVGIGLAWAASPMLLATIYVRGALGAGLALGLLPWMAWVLAAPLKGRAWRRVVGAVAAGMVLAAAHPGLATAGTLVLALGGLLLGRRQRWWLALPALAAAAAMLMTTSPSAVPFTQFSWPYQWLSAAWGYAVHGDPWGPGTPAPMSVGMLTLALFGAAALVSPAGRRERVWAAALVVVALLLASTGWAAPLWASVGEALAPWHLVALASFTLLWVALPGIGPLLLGRGAPAAALALLALVLAIPALQVPTTAVTPAAQPLASFAGGRILLIDAELRGPLRHGATPRLALYWQVTAPVSADYTVFAHVLQDGSDHKWAQSDSWPAEGLRPTSGWRPGEVVEDVHALHVGADGPREGYHVLVGLYHGDTGERLLRDDGSGAVRLVPGE